MNSAIPTYSDRIIIKDALTIFFEKYELGADGGMSQRWVKIKFGKIYFPIPNTASRKKALMFHDIHHIATGYESNLKGEAAIGAWEVSTGCGNYYAAWILDIWAFTLGILVFPKTVFQAFIRGQRTMNLYHHIYTQEELLQMEVSEVQAKLKLNVPVSGPAKPREMLLFITWSFTALIVSFLCFVAPYLLVLWLYLR
jgi:hypothetical protein